MTRQVEGRYRERRVLKDVGAWSHPMSGAGRIKGDGSDESTLYEVKDRTGKSREYRVRESELLDHWKLATKEGKEPVFIIEFGEVRATIHIDRRWGER